MSQFATVLSTLVERLQSRLTDEGRPVNRVSLYPGTNATWDADSMMYVRHVQTFPSMNFPYQQFQPRGDGLYVPNAVRLVAGILRPAQGVIDDGGNAPAPALVTADALAEADDTVTLSQFFWNDIDDTIPGVKAKHFNSVDPQPTMGAMHGVEMTFFVLLDAC